ncbi:MAG: hypothetical protein L0338_10845 [Acidobacteria bacterium]|nr:hypothetical protein [Acidobacteriota bacterium]
MLFATSSEEMVLFLLIVIPLAMLGMKKTWKWFDDKGEVKEATQKGVLGLVNRWFKK